SAAPTSTALLPSLNPSNFGQQVTFTATVTSAAGTPGGTVTFKEGAATLGTGNLNGSGVATFSTSTLSAGTHTITADYPATGNFAGSTTQFTQTVNAIPTGITLSSSGNTFVTRPVTFTATVTATTGTPTGSVTFKDAGTALGPPVNLDAGGVATLTTSTLALGTH